MTEVGEADVDMGDEDLGGAESEDAVIEEAAEPLRHDLRWIARPRVALGAAMAAYVWVFGNLTWAQQTNFGTFGFDMGIYDQGIWLLSRFKTPFVTVRGLNYFGHHVNLITLLLVPFYWLGAGPHMLYLVETLAIASGAIPLFLLGRERLGDEWHAVAISACYLLYPSLEWINWWHFHPDALIITPLLWAYLFATRKNWKWFAITTVIALSCKEDAALAVFVLGLLVAWRSWRTPTGRTQTGREPGVRAERRVGVRTGLATAAGAIAWFGVCTKVIIFRANGGIGPLYDELYPGLGHDVVTIFFNAIRHPTRVLRPAFEAKRITYYTMLLAPVGFVALLALPVLAIAGPQTAVNVVSAHVYTYDIMYHYSSIICAVVFLAVVEGIATWKARLGGTGGVSRMAVQRALVGVVVATSLAANVAWSPSPISTKFHTGIWAKANPQHAIIRQAIALLPKGQGVTATYYLVPHITHRTHAYEFPNPWVQANWGIKGEGAPNAATVDWLLIDENITTDTDASLLADLVADGGEFKKVFEVSGILLAQRIRPPVNAKGPPPKPASGL